MNIVNTTAPLSIDNLKKFFVDKDILYIIDYKNSSIKGSKLLTYLSNLDIPCDIDFKDCSEEECYNMIKEYMHFSMLVNIRSLELVVISLLMQFKGLIKKQDERFIKENNDIIKHWITRVDSLTLYNMLIVDSQEFKDFVENFPTDDTDSLVGVNFLSLIKNPEMYDLYQTLDESAVVNYKKYFNEYMFKGKNLYSYWANENNPMFLLTYNIASGDLSANEYNEVKLQTIKEFQNVASV